MKVDRSAGETACWPWLSVKGLEGHGRIKVFVDGRWKFEGAHRVSWMLHFTAIPEGLSVLHRCDRGDCVNPSHLFLGTQKDNIRDAVKKGRWPSRRGELSPCAKLSSTDALAIRTLSGKRTRKSLAIRFGVGVRHIGDIQNGKS